MPDPIPITPGRQQIVDIYAETLTRLRGVVSGVDFTAATKRMATEKILDIRKHIARLKRDNAAWTAKYLPDAYRIGFDQDEELLLKTLGSGVKAGFRTLHRDAAKVVAEAALVDLNIVADALDDTYTGYIIRAQIQGKRDLLQRRIAGAIVEGQTRRTTSRVILNDLRDRVVAGQITVGKVTMNARAYAEMLARTVVRSARTDGTVNRLIENDIDLVIISDTGAVDFCQQYENQIFSISGKSRRFPKLELRPPYHPNCTHTLSAFIVEFADEGEIEAGSKFKHEDIGKSAREMAKKYPITTNDRRARTKRTQKRAA